LQLTASRVYRPDRGTGVSRNAHTFKHWPQLCEELAHAVKAHDAIIDEEIVCLDTRGRSNFKSLLFRREWPYFHALICSQLTATTCESGRSRSGSDDCAD
jgi:hypothetical protein